MDFDRLLTDRCRLVDASGIRKVFDLGAKLKDPINLSIGQPDFPVPDPVKRAACSAIESDKNGYTLTQGIPALRDRIADHLATDLGWGRESMNPGGSTGVLVTAGTSGALVLAMMALLGPGDEIIIPDPYFVAYPHLATIFGARAVRCSIYPDFRMTAERIEPLITDRTKAVLLNSPGNPCGTVATGPECASVERLCRDRGIVLISDEIYDEFCFSDAMEPGVRGGPARCPSPARCDGAQAGTLVIRGFGKTYGCTGWRMGYAAGPAPLIEQMTKFQQYSFVCAPAPLQWGCIETFDYDMSPTVARYEARRNLVLERLGRVTDIAPPGGAFYAFVRVPERLGQTGRAFCERAVERGVLIIPGGVFSDRDTHFRLSYATSEDRLEKGLDILAELMR